MNNKRFFYQNEFTIQKQVFTPRFETEQLVDLTCQYIKHWFKKPGRILEIGSGSGVIALSLKQRFSQWHIDAVDIDKRAVNNTNLNKNQTGLEICCWQSDLFSRVNRQYDVIVANLPYLSQKELVLTSVLINDPAQALFGGRDGLKHLRAFLKQVPLFLKNRYLIACEIGTKQSQVLKSLTNQFLPKANVLVQKDYNQLDRFLFIYN